jgi:hypothetical protein
VVKVVKIEQNDGFGESIADENQHHGENVEDK